MSHRPLEQKKLNRLRKALRQTPPAKINLIHYLKLHRHAQTTGEAKKIILARRVRSESHVLGIEQGLVNEKTEKGDIEVKLGDVVQPFVMAAFKENLAVLPE